MKGQDPVSGIGECQVLVRVERLERRLGTLINPVTNGGMDTKEKK